MPIDARNTAVIRHGINHVLSYGQSLSNGWDARPLPSRLGSDSVMLGHSVRPRVEAGVGWEPMGEPMGETRLEPLRPTAQAFGQDTLLTTAELAALPPEEAMLGETILESALPLWRRRMVADGRDSDASRLLGSACGVGGQSIEALSFTAEPGLFHRLHECVDVARAVCANEGLAYGMAAMLFLQGEGNNWGVGGTDDRSAYKQLLGRLRRDFNREILGNALGQGRTAPWFLHQTGGAYSSVTNAIPQAQLEFCLETPNCHLVAPIYPLTEAPRGHLDGNATRWLGAQFGKVMHKVITRGEMWRPLMPHWAEMVGREIRIGFHVPVPPLVWQNPIAGHERIAIPSAGFEICDAEGEVPIESVKRAGPTEVRIITARRVNAGGFVRYPGRNRMGRGCLRDSDPDVADDVFIADDALFAYAGETLRDLVGRPYPLANWCVAFTWDLTAAA